MSSCTNTFRNLLPLCTSNVCPTNSGMMVHARAQVLMGCLARFSFNLLTLRKSFSSTYGPFLALLLMYQTPRSCAPLLTTHSRSAGAVGVFRICDDAGSASPMPCADDG